MVSARKRSPLYTGVAIATIGHDTATKGTSTLTRLPFSLSGRWSHSGELMHRFIAIVVRPCGSAQIRNRRMWDQPNS